MKAVVLSSKECADAYKQFITQPKHPCQQCGKEMGFEWILGPVCGECCRKNHRKVVGK